MNRNCRLKTYKPLSRGTSTLKRSEIKRGKGFKKVQYPRPAIRALIDTAAEAGLHLIRAVGLKRSPISRKPSVEQAEKQRRWNVITATKVAAGCGCKRCGTRGWVGNALIGHHRHPKGQGGPWTKSNHDLLCEICHAWVHDNVAEAVEGGWLIVVKQQIQAPAEAAPSQRGAA